MRIRKVVSSRPFRSRPNIMNSMQEAKMVPAIFVGRWTPKVLFSLKRETSSARAVASPYRKGLPAAYENSPQSRIHRTNLPGV